MTQSDNESKLDELERDSLLKAISEVETAKSVSTPGTRSVFENFLQNAKGRVAALDKKIQESKAEHAARKQAEVAIAALAEKEAALSASEKQTYSGFLAKGFFTKNDFGALEKFYAQTWDRLSESGKDQMSHRIYEGIRRGEYKFTDLPKVVQEKEMERAYKRIRDSKIGSAEIEQIPATDREDFLRAYEAGKREEAAKILDRESFKNGMFLGAESKRVDHHNVEMGNEKAGQETGARIRDGNASTKAAPQVSDDDDFSTVKKDGGKTAENFVEPSAANIPNAKIAQSGRSNSIPG
jgi:hypothetical protein